MKRFLPIIIISLFSISCVTNNFTKEDFDKSERPLEPSLAWGTSLMPGLTQALNGEYLEAIGYFVPFVAGAFINSQFQPQENGEFSSGDETPYYLSLSAILGIITASYIDGIHSTKVRYENFLVFKKTEQETIKNNYTARKEERIAKFSPEEQNAIRKKSFYIGMSRAALIESIGNPRDINKSVGDWGIHEQFVYRDTYIYVENGFITSYQQ